MSSDTDKVLAAALREWLDADESGRQILRLLAEDQANGSIALLQRLGAGNAPATISTAIEGGQVGHVINVASAEALNFVGAAPSVSPSYVVERLRLGWNCFNLATLITAHLQNPAEYPHPAGPEVAGMVTEINEVFGTSIAAPLTPMPPRNYLDYFVHRIESRDPLGGAVFRLGGCLCLWWQFKGRHGDEMDAELWGAVDTAVKELGFRVPGADGRVRAVLVPLRPGVASNDETPAMMDAVGVAIAGG